MDTYAIYLTSLIQGILAVILLILCDKSIKNLYGVRVSHKRVNNFHAFLDNLKCSFGLFGEQGVGKSLLMTYIIMYLQPQKFFDLQYEYYKNLPIRDKLLECAKNGILFEWKLYKTREESLDFYVKNIKDYIPCVYAFKEQEITSKSGKKSYELKPDHFTMKQRLPEKNLLACDEFGDRFNNSARRKDLGKANLTDDELIARIETENTFKMASTHRQVSDGLCILADQRKGDISLAFKGTCSKKWYLVSLELKYTAEFIQKQIRKLKSKIVNLGNQLKHPTLADKIPKGFNPKKAEKKLARLTKIDNYLSKIERKIGFFKIGYYEENGSEEVANLNKKDIRYICVPRNLDFNFNSRGYLLTNPTIDKNLSI